MRLSGAAVVGFGLQPTHPVSLFVNQSLSPLVTTGLSLGCGREPRERVEAAVGVTGGGAQTACSLCCLFPLAQPMPRSRNTAFVFVSTAHY